MCTSQDTGTKQISTDLAKRADWDEGQGLRNYKFGPDNDYITQMWQQHYAAIKNCNSVIDNVTEHKDRINNWERYVAEARGVRAYLYFDLVRLVWRCAFGIKRNRIA